MECPCAKRLRGILVTDSSGPRKKKKLTFSEQNEYVDAPFVEEEAYHELRERFSTNSHDEDRSERKKRRKDKIKDKSKYKDNEAVALRVKVNQLRLVVIQLHRRHHLKTQKMNELKWKTQSDDCGEETKNTQYKKHVI